MAKIRNLSRTVQRVTDRAGATTDLAPGETFTIAVDQNDVRFAAKVRARLIEVEGQAATAARTPRKRTSRRAKPAANSDGASASGAAPSV